MTICRLRFWYDNCWVLRHRWLFRIINRRNVRPIDWRIARLRIMLGIDGRVLGERVLSVRVGRCNGTIRLLSGKVVLIYVRRRFGIVHRCVLVGNRCLIGYAVIRLGLCVGIVLIQFNYSRPDRPHDYSVFNVVKVLLNCRSMNRFLITGNCFDWHLFFLSFIIFLFGLTVLVAAAQTLTTSLLTLLYDSSRIVLGFVGS